MSTTNRTRAGKTSPFDTKKEITAAGYQPSAEEQNAYFHELTDAERQQLVDEIVESRAAELCRAYEGVVSVFLGYGLEKDSKNEDLNVRQVPCVTFLVRSKWRGSEARRTKGRIPSHLLAYWHGAGRSMRVAVPTDVDDGRDHTGVEPHTAPGIHVRINASTSEQGAIACAVRRSGLDKTYFISAKHVLNASSTLYPDNQWGSAVHSAAGGLRIGKTLGVAGALSNIAEESFDAQLGRVENEGALRDAMKNIDFRAVARSSHDVPPDYFILAPGGAIPAERAGYPPNYIINYGRSGIDSVVHRVLLQSLCTPGTLSRGISGSPIMSARAGGTLLGMHIAGNDRRSFAIPAWRLLSARNYLRTSSRERWEILTGDEIADLGRLEETIETSVKHADGQELLAQLTVDHGFRDSVLWRLASDGIRINNYPPEVTVGPPSTVERVWILYGGSIRRWSRQFGVPVELVVATICTESRGDASAIRREPGYESDTSTPEKISVGLMQTLISTASEALPESKNR